jgi:Uri superfamily endonuclease
LEVNILPINSGGYVLELYLAQALVIQIGRLGEFNFPAGAYLYFGSACGPGGLCARLSRHLLPAASHRSHWHIDFLRVAAEVRALGYLADLCPDQSAQRLECLWSQAAARLPGSSVPAPGFGASDCRSGCPAHLIFIPKADAGGDPVLFDQKMQNILVSAASLTGAQQDFCWQRIDQSHIAPAVTAKTAST